MQPETDAAPFLRHVRACNNAVLPGARTPLRIGPDRVGFVDPAVAPALEEQPEIARAADGALVLRVPEALERIGRDLAERGLCRWRDEPFDVRARPDGPALARLDRGALPKLGVLSVGVHVNGIVERADGAHLWIGRRSPHKALDPDKLDHLIAGGVPSGLTAEQTLVKEAGEEASVPPELASKAVPAGAISYAMDRPEGLRRDYLLCFDLLLPEAFRPKPNDDEVQFFELWPIRRALEAVRDTDAFKFNVALVMIALFLRRGLIAEPAAARIRAELGGTGSASRG